MRESSMPPWFLARDLARATEVAFVLGVCRRTVQRLVASGRLPPPLAMARRTVRHRVSDVLAYVRGRTKKEDSGMGESGGAWGLILAEAERLREEATASWLAGDRESTSGVLEMERQRAFARVARLAAHEGGRGAITGPAAYERALVFLREGTAWAEWLLTLGQDEADRLRYGARIAAFRQMQAFCETRALEVPGAPGLEKPIRHQALVRGTHRKAVAVDVGDKYRVVADPDTADPVYLSGQCGSEAAAWKKAHERLKKSTKKSDETVTRGEGGAG